jgi:RNA-directed DNA polymerase
MSAGVREIMAPKEKLKYIQRWLNYNILQKANYNHHIQGFVPGTSTYKNATIHKSAKFLLKIDLLKFFDCITDKRVYGIFRSFGYSKNVAWDFTKICTFKHRKSYWDSLDIDVRNKLKSIINDNLGVLPQGAPTSPLLANLVASRLDKRISKLAEKSNFNYSRYADDLCFSASERSNLPSLEFLTKIIEQEGFFVNTQKSKLTKGGMKQYVTGLSITGEISVSKNKRREIFTHLYFLRKYGLELHLQKLKSKGVYHTNFQNWLLGNISYHYSINPIIGKKMFEIFNLINWQIDSNVSVLENQ